MAIDGLVGEIAIETSASTVKLAEPTTVPEVALMLVVPAAMAVVRPALFTVAIVVFEELHMAELLRFCALPSLKVPIAVNCWVEPGTMEAVAGDTLMETRMAAVTVSVVEPDIAPEVAVIVEVPIPMLLPNPCEPDVLLMVATVAVEELHTTVLVISCVLLSVKVPVAVNCFCVPIAIEGVAGVTAIDTNPARVTVSVVVPDTDPEVAVIVAVPVPTLVAKPWLPEVLLIVATEEAEEVHVTVVVRVCVLPSLKVPVAVNCCVVPSAIDPLAGVSARESKAGGETVRVVDPLIPL